MIYDIFCKIGPGPGNHDTFVVISSVCSRLSDLNEIAQIYMDQNYSQEIEIFTDVSGNTAASMHSSF